MAAEEDATHCVHCALLHTARQMLSSGLADVLAAACDSAPTASSKDLCRQVAFCVHAAWPRAQGVLAVLMERLDIPRDTRPCASSSGAGIGADADAPCAVTSGPHGRQLTARTPLRRGDTALADTPFAALATAPCACRAGPLLVEHVAMAVDLFHRHRHECAAALAPPLPSDLLSPTAAPPFTHFIRQVQAGLSSSGQGQRDGDGAGVWRVEHQRLMAAVAAVACCYYSTPAMHEADNTEAPPPPLTAAFQADCWALMQVTIQISRPLSSPYLIPF